MPSRDGAAGHSREDWRNTVRPLVGIHAVFYILGIIVSDLEYARLDGFWGSVANQMPPPWAGYAVLMGCYYSSLFLALASFTWLWFDPRRGRRLYLVALGVGTICYLIYDIGIVTPWASVVLLLNHILIGMLLYALFFVHWDWKIGTDAAPETSQCDASG